LKAYSILAETDSENVKETLKIVMEISYQINHEPMSEIEDNVDTSRPTDDEEHNNEESEAVRDYWSSAVKCARSRFAGRFAQNVGINLQ